MAADPDPGLVGKLQRGIVELVLWPVVPIVLFFAQIWVLKKQNPLLTYCLTAEFIIGLFVVYSFWRLYKQRTTKLTNIIFYLGFFFAVLVVANTLVSRNYFDPFNLRHLELSFQKLTNEENENYPSLPLVDLKNLDLKYANFSYTILYRAALWNSHLEHANLTSAHLEHANLISAHLEHANLISAHLNSVDLSEAHLEHANLWSAHLEYANLSNAHLEHANLSNAHLEHANLRNAHLDSANLISAHLDSADLSGALLGSADLAYGDFNYANFRDADLKHAALFSTRLVHANFTSTSLEHANLIGATLIHADFRYANLDSAIVSNASLEHAYLGSAYLMNADFEDTHLDSANFEDANLDSAIFLNSNISKSALESTSSFYNAVFDADFTPNIKPHSGIWKKWKCRLMSLEINDSLSSPNYDSLRIEVYAISASGVKTKEEIIFHGPYYINNFQLSKIWFDDIFPQKPHFTIKGYRQGECSLELNDSKTLYYEGQTRSD